MDVYNGMIFNHQTWKMYIEKNNLHKKGLCFFRKLSWHE